MSTSITDGKGGMVLGSASICYWLHSSYLVFSRYQSGTLASFFFLPPSRCPSTTYFIAAQIAVYVCGKCLHIYISPPPIPKLDIIIFRPWVGGARELLVFNRASFLFLFLIVVGVVVEVVWLLLSYRWLDGWLELCVGACVLISRWCKTTLATCAALIIKQQCFISRWCEKKKKLEKEKKVQWSEVGEVKRNNVVGSLVDGSPALFSIYCSFLFDTIS